MLGKVVILMIIAIGVVDSSEIVEINTVDQLKIDDYCLGSIHQFCSCNKSANSLPLNIYTTCLHEGRCIPCHQNWIDPINCNECPGNVCPVCSVRKFDMKFSGEGNDSLGKDQSVRKSRESEDSKWPPEDHWCAINKDALGIINCTIKSHIKKCDLQCGVDNHYSFECTRKELVWKPEFKSCEDLEEEYGSLKSNDIPGKDKDRSGRKSHESEDIKWPHEDHWCAINKNDYGIINCTVKSHIKKCDLQCGVDNHYSFECTRKELVWKPEFKSCEDLEEEYVSLKIRNILKKFKTSRETGLTHGVKSADGLMSIWHLARSLMKFWPSLIKYVLPKNYKEGTRTTKPTHEELEFRPNSILGIISPNYLIFKKNVASPFLIFKLFKAKHNVPAVKKTALSTPVELTTVVFEHKKSKESKIYQGTMSTNVSGFEESVQSSILTSVPARGTHLHPENSKVRATPVEAISADFEFKGAKVSEMTPEAKSTYGARFYDTVAALTTVPLETKHASSENYKEQNVLEISTDKQVEIKTSKEIGLTLGVKSVDGEKSNSAFTVRPSPVESMVVALETQREEMFHGAKSTHVREFNRSSSTPMLPDGEPTHEMLKSLDFPQEENYFNDTNELYHIDAVVTEHGKESKNANETEDLNYDTQEDQNGFYFLSTYEPSGKDKASKSDADFILPTD